LYWSVNLEGGLWWYAHVVELPGCFSRGTSRSEALSLLDCVVEERLAWLTARDLNYPHLSGFKVIEEQHNLPELGESGGAVALFSSDLTPIDEGSLGDAERLMQFSRQEVLSAVEQLTEEELDVCPIPGKRTVRMDITHIVNAEEWYISRLGPKYQRVYEDKLRARKRIRRLSAVERLRSTREVMILALETALRDAHQGPFTRRAYTRYPEEQWTLRKVLRRFLEHEREHLGTIRIVLNKSME
jgi:predicted RNase H-like HicB family nuclease/uncharacterized damage-inducible protein DinB